MYNSERSILLIVEGMDDEVNLFKRIIKSFPEISLHSDNILVYNTNLWVLNSDLEKEFGLDWYESEDIDFRIFCEARFPEIKGKKFTDTFLVFDYERQDPKFNAEKLENMCKFFNDSIDKGQLYINYPMVESYRHFNTKPLPDKDYKNRKCNVADISKYKSTVGSETKFQDYRKFDRSLLQDILAHNLKKASFIISNKYELTSDESDFYTHNTNQINIVQKQNFFSKDDTGFVYVLCTCLFFITDYNSNLLYLPSANTEN